MAESHRDHVAALLADAAATHVDLLTQLPDDLRESLPVDAQGITRAIDHLASSAGLTERERIALLRPHAVNPAVLHARVFGTAPLTRETVIASFVDGARVRADSLADLGDAVGGSGLGEQVRKLLVADPPPADSAGDDAVAALQRTYKAQERATLLIAAALDAQD
jgi:hypothetical protein